MPIAQGPLGRRVPYPRRSYPPSFGSKLTKGQGRWAKKSEKSRKSGKVKPGQGGGRYWGGRSLWDNLAYLHQHRRDIAQTFMVDSPSDTIQTHKVLGPSSPRGRVGGQKSLENLEKVMKSCPSKAPGRALARTGADRGRITIEPKNHRTTGYKGKRSQSHEINHQLDPITKS